MRRPIVLALDVKLRVFHDPWVIEGRVVGHEV